MYLLQIGLMASLWCFFHSLFVSHWWRNYLQIRFPRHHLLARIIYVLFSTVTLVALLLWVRSTPQNMLWDWPGWWGWIRWAGLALSGVFIILGARSFDNRAFLGIRQFADFFKGKVPKSPPFKTNGILGVIRHPWYTGTFLFLAFCLPYTDSNLVWRSIFFVYTIIGTELEERKLVGDLGNVYQDYRSRVPRFIPWLNTNK